MIPSAQQPPWRNIAHDGAIWNLLWSGKEQGAHNHFLGYRGKYQALLCSKVPSSTQHHLHHRPLTSTADLHMTHAFAGGVVQCQVHRGTSEHICPRRFEQMMASY